MDKISNNTKQAAVTSHKNIDMIRKMAEPSKKSNFFGIDIIPCDGLEDNDMYMFKTKEQAYRFVDLVKKYGIKTCKTLLIINNDMFK